MTEGLRAAAIKQPMAAWREASGARLASCCICAKPVALPWMLWLSAAELAFCTSCWRDLLLMLRELRPPKVTE